MLTKWKKAVVHLECAADSEHFHDRIKRMEQQRQLVQEGRLTHEQFAEGLLGGSRDLRFHGTALFVSHHGRRYLLTARHVVWDETSARRELEEEAKRAQSRPEQRGPHLAAWAHERAVDRVFNIIFRVPSLNEVIASQSTPAFLMNLGAGSLWTVPYTFSAPDIDLAVISLDQRDRRFADELETKGFAPVSSDDISNGPDEEGQEVFTIGFPEETALVGQVSLAPALAHWASSHFSLPVSSFGRVSMLHDVLPFFWADMSIYPGNSGGPVIADGRLVGIVSAQATLPVDAMPQLRTRIPFARIIKTCQVGPLLDAQEKKDRPWEEMRTAWVQ